MGAQPVVRQVSDPATEMVSELRQLCVVRPKSVVFIVNSRPSYTGMRTGWCIARGIAAAWGAKIWYVRMDGVPSCDEEIVRALEEPVAFNPRGLVYDGDEIG